MTNLSNALDQDGGSIAPIPILAEPAGGLWFKHASPLALAELRPLSYQELAQARPDYDVQARRATELAHKKALGLGELREQEQSLLYATVAGSNAMEPASSYPGFTYFFRLSEAQIDRCLFGVVDKVQKMDPKAGRAGLDEALALWESESESMSFYHEPGLGRVEPRVEVIIPFAVRPICYIPQSEDRPARDRADPVHPPRSTKPGRSSLE